MSIGAVAVFLATLADPIRIVFALIAGLFVPSWKWVPVAALMTAASLELFTLALDRLGTPYAFHPLAFTFAVVAAALWVVTAFWAIITLT